MDVGCGASFIYCLLGAALYGWHMTGLDITEVNVKLLLAALSDRRSMMLCSNQPPPPTRSALNAAFAEP